MNAIHTGERIAELRRGKGMTQKELADILHVTNKAVSKWECGKNYPDLTQLPTLAEALGTSVSDLLGLDEPLSNDTIAVISAVTRQESTAIKQSLYQFVITSMIVCILYVIFCDAAVYPRWLLGLHIVPLVNGAFILEQLSKKFSRQKDSYWSIYEGDVFLSNVRIQLAFWRDRFRRK